jgi:DNA polymerase-3 subunit epsilon
MTGWHLGPLLAFDTESSGRDPHHAFIVSAACAQITPDEGAAQHLYLLQPPPGAVIPDEAAAVHGISTDHAVEHGTPRRDTLDKIAEHITGWLAAGRPLVAMNAAYDCTLLETELHRENLPTVTQRLGRPISPVIDPYLLDKQVDKWRKGGRQLEQLCEHYQVRIDGAHDAGHDALAAARVAWRIGQRHPELARLSLPELHANQVHWAKEQMDGLRAYFDRNGIEHDGCDGHWPIRQQPAAVPA